jgi:hypothetical protein
LPLPIIGLIGAAISAVTEIGKSYFERKKIESEGRVRVAEARVEGEIKRALTMTEGDAAYDLAAAEQMESSWKDEWLTIMLSIPAILCFIPGGAQYVKAGFSALTETPEWYQWAFLGMVIASFGLKSIVRPLLAKWFGTKDTSLIQPQPDTEKK